MSRIKNIARPGETMRQWIVATAACTLLFALTVAIYLGRHHRSDRLDSSAESNHPSSLGANSQGQPAGTGSPAKPEQKAEVQREGRKAYYSGLSKLLPVAGEATQVVDQLTPAAKAGDSSAALAIYMKVNDCRLRAMTAQRQAPNTDPLSVIPPDCAGLSPEDYIDAGQWIERAADAGNADAQLLYATSPEGVLGPPSEWLRHPEKVAQYKHKALAYLVSHAEGGSIDAMQDLSTAYQYGVITDRNPINAIAYYRAAQLASGSDLSATRLEWLKSELSPTEIRKAEDQSRRIYEKCCR